MTLGEFIEQIGQHPGPIIFFFLFLPLAALLAGILGKGEGHLTPWRYLYATLVYLVCVPGIFAISLSVYLFLFERIGIFQTNLFTQVLPVISMLTTLWLIRRNVSFDDVPGFDKLSALVLMIFSTIVLMWVIDRTYIIVFASMPVTFLFGLFAVFFLVVRFTWKRLVG